MWSGTTAHAKTLNATRRPDQDNPKPLDQQTVTTSRVGLFRFWSSVMHFKGWLSVMVKLHLESTCEPRPPFPASTSNALRPGLAC